MLKTIERTPAYAYAQARRDAGEPIDPEKFAKAYQRAKDVWRQLHPEDKYYRPSEFYVLYIQDSTEAA